MMRLQGTSHCLDQLHQVCGGRERERERETERERKRDLERERERERGWGRERERGGENVCIFELLSCAVRYIVILFVRYTDFLYILL